VAPDHETSLTGPTVPTPKILILSRLRVAGIGREQRGPFWSPLRVPGQARLPGRFVAVDRVWP
jgi:hypothetical protein